MADLLDPDLLSAIDALNGQAFAGGKRLDFQGMIVPSVRWPCNNLVLFVERIDLNENIRLQYQTEVNWPAWRERSEQG